MLGASEIAHLINISLCIYRKYLLQKRSALMRRTGKPIAGIRATFPSPHSPRDTMDSMASVRNEDHVCSPKHSSFLLLPMLSAQSIRSRDLCQGLSVAPLF